MDSKNVIAAIALSSAVIVLYSLFFIPEKTAINKNVAEREKIEQSSDTPSLEQKETTIKISRGEALNQSERVVFEQISEFCSFGCILTHLACVSVYNVLKNV